MPPAKWILLACILGALGCETAQTPSALSYPIPNVNLATLTDAGREHVSAAHGAAVAEPNRVEVVGQLARVLHAYGYLSEALHGYGRAAALDSEDHRWPYLAGVVHQQRNEPAAAIEPFQRALDRKPQFVPAEIRLAEALLEIGELQESYALLSGVRRRDPLLARAYFALGKVDAASERYARAISMLERAIELDPHAGGSHLALAFIYRAIGRPADSRDQLEEYRVRLPSGPTFSDPLADEIPNLRADWDQLWRSASTAEEDLDLARARETYNQLLGWPQGRWRAHAALSRISARMGDFGNAETHYWQARALRPDAAEVHYSRGLALYEEERYTEAQQVFQRAIDLAPNSQRAHTAMARALRRLGLILEAEHHEQEASSLRAVTGLDDALDPNLVGAACPTP